MAGIDRFGAYVPQARLQRDAVYQANAWFAPGLRGLAKGERAIANWDEDAVTMAVEAARDCLSDADRADIGSIIMASTSFPFADRQNAVIVKEALALRDDLATLDVASSQRAGTSALVQALHSAAGGVSTLVLASEQRRARPASEAELVNGDAAAAFLVGPDDGIARLIGTHSVSVDFVDHFRAAEARFDYEWESRWVRDEGYANIAGGAVVDALLRFGVTGSQIDHFVAAIPARGVAAQLARKAGIPAQSVADDLADRVGHAGTAQSMLMLAHILETARPGQRILLLGFGQGADVLLFETTPAITGASANRGVSGWVKRRRSETNYLKYLAFTGNLGLELGKRAEFDQKPVLTALYRNRKAVLGLIGGRCTRTGTVQFPASEISVNQQEPAVGTQEDYPLADRRARILTFTADSLTYTPDPPNHYGMIEFDGGGRMLAEFADIVPGSIDVGTPMRMMFRIKAHDERTGFSKYFWKAVPEKET